MCVRISNRFLVQIEILSSYEVNILRSLLYKKMLADEKCLLWRNMESDWIIKSLDFLEPERAKERMIILKNYVRELNTVFFERLNEFEIFAEDCVGNLWLENQKNGIASFFIFHNGYYSDFFKLKFASVEAAVFAILLKYAETYIAELGIEYGDMRYEFRDAIDRIADLLPVEWSTELYVIAEKPFEKSCSLLTPEQLRQLIDKYSLLYSDS